MVHWFFRTSAQNWRVDRLHALRKASAAFSLSSNIVVPQYGSMPRQYELVGSIFCKTYQLGSTASVTTRWPQLSAYAEDRSTRQRDQANDDGEMTTVSLCPARRDVRGKCQRNTRTTGGTCQALRRHDDDDDDSVPCQHSTPRIIINIDHYCASMAFLYCRLASHLCKIYTNSFTVGPQKDAS